MMGDWKLETIFLRVIVRRIHRSRFIWPPSSQRRKAFHPKRMRKKKRFPHLRAHITRLEWKCITVKNSCKYLVIKKREASLSFYPSFAQRRKY